MKTSETDTPEMLQTLRSAVAKTLERKRRLGHYAVLWKDGEIVFTEGDRHLARMKSMNSVLGVNEDSQQYNDHKESNGKPNES